MGEIANKYFEGEPVWRFFNIEYDYKQNSINHLNDYGL